MEVHQSNKRIKVLNWGRRSGKGVCASYEGLGVANYLAYIERPAIMVPHHRLWVVGMSYPQLNQAWEEFDHLFRWVPHLETRPPLIDEKIRFLANDGRLQFKSADNPNSLQNEAVDWVWMTEAQDLPDSVWDEKVSPMLHSPGVLGWAIIEGHAPKPGSFFERLFDLGQRGHPDIDSWLFHTKDNPYIDWDKILLEAQDMPEEAFRKEYFCEYPSVLGRAFSEDAVDMCVGGDLEEPKEGVIYSIGVDLGKLIDPTVIIVMRKSQKRVVGFERLLKTDWTIQEDIITSWSQKWNNAHVYLDETGLGQPVVDRLKKNGVSVKGINMTKQKNEMLNKMAAALEHGDIRFPKIPTLVKELKSMRRTQKDSHGRELKQERIAAPVGYHDDCPIALALAYHGCRYSGDYVAAKPRDLRRSI